MGLLELLLGAIGFIAILYGCVNLWFFVTTDDNKKYLKQGLMFLAIGVVICFVPSFYTVVDAGNVAVQKTFGIVDENVLDPGLHVKNPFTEIIPMSIRTLKYTDYDKDDKATITALSHDGLQTTMGIAVNYHLVPSKVPEIYKQVGTDYENVVMVNPIHSVPRDLISKYDTKTLYSASQEGSTDRAKLEQELYEGITARLNEVGERDSIIIEQVSIRDIDFPEVYKTSISEKMKMDTEIQQKQLEVKKQEMEAQRVTAEAEGTANKMRVEAQGQADAARIVAQGVLDASNKIGGVPDQYIQWYYIQTMKDNPRAIYIPVGPDGLPLVKTV
jgi:regulator of protease activity HflC (stomatin/prohibitin superfamily)